MELAVLRWSLILVICVGSIWTHANLKIGAWNVQTFGTKKLGTESEMIHIIETILRYDVVLIQEIRDATGVVIPTTLERLNNADRNGAWKVVHSERLGRSSYKEQYAYFYRSSVLSVVAIHQFDDGPDDGDDWFAREPFAVLFHSPTTELGRFGLIGIHTAPTDAALEISYLDEVLDDTIAVFGTENIFVLGDFNADCTYMSEADWSNVDLLNQDWLIPNDADTTVSATNCAYDRIVAAGNLTQYIVRNSASVHRFDLEYNLSTDEAKQVSDHYPVEVDLIGQSRNLSENIGNDTAVATGFSLKRKASLNDDQPIRAIYRAASNTEASGYFCTEALLALYQPISRISFAKASKTVSCSQVDAELLIFDSKFPGILTQDMLDMAVLHVATVFDSYPATGLHFYNANGLCTISITCDLEDLSCVLEVEKQWT